MAEQVRRTLAGIGLRWRLLALLIAVGSVLIVDRTWDVATARTELLVDARQQLLVLARTGAGQQSAVVSEVRAILAVAVEMPEAGALAGQACQRPYGKAVEAVPWLLALAVVDRRGDLRCSSNPSANDVNVADRDYYKEAVRSHDFVLSRFLTSRVQSQPAMIAAMPRFTATGELESVVVARIDLEWLQALTARLGAASGTSVLLADAAGTIVAAYPDRDRWLGRPTGDLGLPRLLSGFGDRVVESRRPGAAAGLFAAVELAGNAGWLLVGRDRDAILDSVDRETAVAALKLGAIFILSVAALWFGADRVVLRPVETLAGVSNRLGDGDLAARADERGLAPEVKALARAFNEMADRLAAREADLRAANEHLSRLATVDGLTGLANRRLFDERLAQEWQRAGMTGRPVGLVIIDIDFFKAFNDFYGHPEGDTCLRRVARVIGGERRATDLAARLGGEEFGILLPGADAHRTIHIARLVRIEVEALAIPHVRSNAGIVTVSAGISALSPAAGATGADLLKAADDALYRAKRAGRNRVAGPVLPSAAAGTAASA